jgi:hypothetical protein
MGESYSKALVLDEHGRLEQMGESYSKALDEHYRLEQMGESYSKAMVLDEHALAYLLIMDLM